MSSKSVFKGPGVVIGRPIQGYQCITIKGAGAETYFQQAPATGIRIDEQVDFSLSKTLAGNFNLVTFEDLPVTITIRGMRSLYSSCGNSRSRSIGELYKRLKASKSSYVRTLDIVIGGAQQYRAVIVAFTQASSQEAPGILTYNLTLFGVRVR